jgi:homoserine kinase type II
MRRMTPTPAALVAPAANHVSADAVEACAASAATIVSSWRDASGATSIQELAVAVAAGEAPYSDMPRQLLHGDFWDNNVLFRDGRVVAVLDLDFMEVGPRIDDLALVLYYAGPGADLPSLVRAYAAGADPALSRSERLALPFAIARTCLHFTRHLTLRIAELEQREVLEANRAELAWGLQIARDARRWQEAFGA